MISTLEIRNFKCFQSLRLGFGPLTLLTGFNGGGKSTALQPLLLLAQGLRGGEPNIFALNGPLVHLGTIGDISRIDADSAISFKITDAVGTVSWTFSARAGDRFLRSSVGNINHADTPDAHALGSTLSHLTYLSAVREGADDAFPIPDNPDESSRDVGVEGAYAPYLYNLLADEEVRSERRQRDEPAASFRKQLDAWIGTLFPGAQANVQLVPQLSLLNLQFRLSGIGDWRRPANVGYGLTYAFPILVALLAADRGQLVIIDSPEAHLHPSAQSQMGRILAQFASAGVQIFVETHSDHLLNGARLAVKENVLAHSEVCLHFFTGAGKHGHGIVSPALDAEGRINEWPKGFFDQSEKDLSQLAGWQ